VTTLIGGPTLWISGLPAPDSGRSLRQATYPQLLHHVREHDPNAEPPRRIYHIRDSIAAFSTERRFDYFAASPKPYGARPTGTALDGHGGESMV